MPAADNQTIESWARAYLAADDFASKLAPAPPPDRFAHAPAAERIPSPSRGPAFRIATHGQKSTGKSALRSDTKRAQLLHTFLHHELQAAELMAWAILAFPGTPEALRRGLLHILLDEVRHMNLYAALLAERGVAVGAFEVRDWFWERVPRVQTIDCFLATLGLGFEGANLDHASLFEDRFRRAGDERAAAVQAQVAAEEVPHVRFALTWFRETSPLVRAGVPLFEAFARSLPEPLSPLVMRGRPLARELRRRAGLDDGFLAGLEGWSAT